MLDATSTTLPREKLSLSPEISDRLKVNGFSELHVVGSLGCLFAARTAFLCSSRTPGESILKSHDAARLLRDNGLTVISGFHSPIEKECLKILLRGKQPIIICPARAIENMRIPKLLRPAFDEGRILFLSAFQDKPRRVTRESAMRRNEVVAALADAAFIPHITPGGETDRIAGLLRRWEVPICSSLDELRAMQLQSESDVL